LIFEVLTSLRIQVSWDMMLGCWMKHS